VVVGALGAALPARLPYLLWVIAEIVGFGASLAAVLRTGDAPVRWQWVILAVGAAFVPYVTWFDLYHGQVDFMLLTLLFAYGPIAEANHLLVLCPAIFMTLRLGLGPPNAERRRRWRPATVAWIVFLLCTAGPIRQLTWTEQIPGVPEGLAVLLTGRVGVLLLAAGIATAWSLAQEHRASNPQLSLGAPLDRLRSPRVASRTTAEANSGSSPPANVTSIEEARSRR
jgi:hypothetical protein